MSKLDDQRRNIRIGDLLLSLLMGSLLCAVAIPSWSAMPEFRLWKSVDLVLLDGHSSATLSGVVHLFVGLMIFVPSFYAVIEIVRINQRAQGGKNKPLYLLTDGYYAGVRHPMTGRFMLIVFGFFFSLASLVGLLMIAFFSLFFHATTLYEERKWLLPRFGEEYRSYAKAVPRRYFSQELLWMLVITFVSALVGAIL